MTNWHTNSHFEGKIFLSLKNRFNEYNHNICDPWEQWTKTFSKVLTRIAHNSETQSVSTVPPDGLWLCSDPQIHQLIVFSHNKSFNAFHLYSICWFNQRIKWNNDLRAALLPTEATTSTTPETRRRWRGESGGDTSFTMTTSAGPCSHFSPSLLERDGLSKWILNSFNYSLAPKCAV